MLDLADEAPLLSKVSATGFGNVNGFLGMGGGYVLHNEGAAWVHSREKDSGGGAIKIGSQRLVVVSDILEYYMSAAAMKASADSYGGVNTKAVYLNPSSSISYGTNSVVEVMGSESGGSSSGGSSTSGSGTSGGTTGGETGGTTGGGSGTTDNGGSDNTGGDDDEVEGTGGDE